MTGWVARRRGWDPVLVLVDVTRDDALAGQRRRGHMVRAGCFDRHWRRWQDQRDDLTRVARRGESEGPWAQVHVVDRDRAASLLPALLAHRGPGAAAVTRRTPRMWPGAGMAAPTV